MTSFSRTPSTPCRRAVASFAAGLLQFGKLTVWRLKLVSFFLLDATVLIPLGFFLGGLAPSESDPWKGIILVPLGALLLFIAVAIIIVSCYRRTTGEQSSAL